MHDALRPLSLTLPDIPIGRRGTMLDLKCLLYRGGARLHRNKAGHAIQQGVLGDVVPERIKLVYSLHTFIAGKLAAGGSPVTASNHVADIRAFFAWAEQADCSLSTEEVEATFLNWTEYLFHRARVLNDMSERTAYSVASRLGNILDGVLERQKPILHLTRLTRPKIRKSPLGSAAEKQNLHDSFAFGHLLQDICDGLPLNVVQGPSDVRIALQGGGTFVPWTVSSRRTSRPWAAWEVRSSEKRKLAYESDRSLTHRGRTALANTRILAELLMFIGQTGMNLAQAHSLKLRHFSYSSDVDGYKVREYKKRRGGEVLFEIFSEYRSHFERYLEWRRVLFPDSDNLFPVIRQGSPEMRPPLFDLIIGACKQVAVPWIPSAMLRGTRVNWLLRRSGDPDLTADIAQHHKQTLLRVYERPSLQRAVAEVARFWQDNDPVLTGALSLRAVAPGQCDGSPLADTAKPATAPSPDCTRPSGCLWCEHHRDIDSLDYVWSISCFRHLKILEMSKHVPPSTAERLVHPAQCTIDKLTEKLNWFKNSNEQRRNWVEEALARVEEGAFHQEWKYLIEQIEGAVK